MKFEIYLLHRDEVWLKYIDVQSAIAFLSRLNRGVLAYSIVARRGEKAIFIEKVTNLIELSKQLTEFMVRTASQQ